MLRHLHMSQSDMFESGYAGRNDTRVLFPLSHIPGASSLRWFELDSDAHEWHRAENRELLGLRIGILADAPLSSVHGELTNTAVAFSSVTL